MRNVFAYTAPHGIFPEFISINIEEGEIKVIVRSPVQMDLQIECAIQQHSAPGRQAMMTLPREQVQELRNALFEALKATPN